MTTRFRGETRRCPIGGGRGLGGLGSCGRVVRAGMLVCAPHWRQVPKALQSDVWATWRRFQRTSSDEAWAEYAAARQAALDSIERSTP